MITACLRSVTNTVNFPRAFLLKVVVCGEIQFLDMRLVKLSSRFFETALVSGDK